MKNIILVIISVALIAVGLIFAWYSYNNSTLLSGEINSMNEKISDLSQQIESMRLDLGTVNEDLEQTKETITTIGDSLNKLQSYGPSADLFK